MRIEFENVIPEPLKETYSQTSEVWNTTLVMDRSKKVLIKANSGKGKSTLLQLIIGLRSDYSGLIKINHKDIRLFTRLEFFKVFWFGFAQRSNLCFYVNGTKTTCGNNTFGSSTF